MMTEKASFLYNIRFLFLVLLPLGATAQTRGHVDVKAERCSFDDAIFLYNTPVPRTQESVGVLQDGAKVTITKKPGVKT